MNDPTDDGFSATGGKSRPPTPDQPGDRRHTAAEADQDQASAEQQLVSTHYFSTIDDVIDALRAADVLGLGVRVANRFVADDEPDTHVEEWVMELFAYAQYVDG